MTEGNGATTGATAAQDTHDRTWQRLGRIVRNGPERSETAKSPLTTREVESWAKDPDAWRAAPLPRSETTEPHRREVDPHQVGAGSGDGRCAGMSEEAGVRRSDKRNLVRRASPDDLDAIGTIGIDEDLSLHEEVADGAVIVGTDVWDHGAVGTAPDVGEGCGKAVEPRERVEGRTQGGHPPIEGDQRGHQDLSSESLHPSSDLLMPRSRGRHESDQARPNPNAVGRSESLSECDPAIVRLSRGYRHHRLSDSAMLRSLAAFSAQPILS